MSNGETAQEYKFENEFAFVDQDGAMFLKPTSETDKRKLGEIDTDSEIDPQLKPFREAYQKFISEIEEIKEVVEDGPDSDDLGKRVEKLIEKAKTEAFIGDVELLLGELRDLKKEISQSGDQSESENDASAGDENKPVEDQSNAEVEGSLVYYRELVEKAESLSEQSDWPYITQELKLFKDKWVEGPQVDDKHKEDLEELSDRFQKAQDHFEERKQNHYEKLKQKKHKNLEKKKELLQKMKDIVENKQWKAKKKVKDITNHWNNIHPLPSGKEEELENNFSELVSEFNEHKVDYLVQKKEKEEENLKLKLVILDKMELLAESITAETEDWKKLHNDFKDLKRQWQKVGKVPPNKNRNVWERYKNAQDLYYDNKFKYDRIFRDKIEKALKKKIRLCEEAEALVDMDDLAKGAQKINRLHRKWKKAGNLPQKEENELWDRFKAATDAFNQKKSDNIDLLRKQEEEHYQQKLELIEEAENIKDTTEWQSGADKMQHLMKRWKEIGPVPRSKNKKIWKQFKGAMDHFYDRRREHFKKVKKEQKENLKKKNKIIEQLRELGEHEDPIEAVEEAKKLQEKFKSIGYVPIKQKNRSWKQYREACDVIYDRYRAAKSNKSTTNVLKAKGYESDEIKKIQKNKKKISKLESRAKELNEQIIQHKEAQTYFKPSGKGNDLRDELQQKIDKAEAELADIEDKIEKCEQKLNQIEE